uniref:(northern house mosquito) hypothetical protein n=1 Tax=Culex pipiens TaxID=7175 RepID=A0A8D8C9N7_CULPI
MRTVLRKPNSLQRLLVTQRLQHQLPRLKVLVHSQQNIHLGRTHLTNVLTPLLFVKVRLTKQLLHHLLDRALLRQRRILVQHFLLNPNLRAQTATLNLQHQIVAEKQRRLAVPGGNFVLVRIEAQKVHVANDGRGTEHVHLGQKLAGAHFDAVLPARLKQLVRRKGGDPLLEQVAAVGDDAAGHGALVLLGCLVQWTLSLSILKGPSREGVIKL